MEGICAEDVQEWQRFVDSMEKNREYATNTCIHALAEIYGTTIRVLTGGKSKSGDYWLEVVPKDPKVCACVVGVGGVWRGSWS